MCLFNYTNGFVGYNQADTFNSHYIAATEYTPSFYSNLVKNITPCIEGCNGSVGSQPDVKNVQHEVEPSVSTCPVPYGPTPDGFLPGLYIPGSTVFIVYLFLRMLLNVRMADVSSKAKD